MAGESAFPAGAGDPLVGSWAATRWQYHSRNEPARMTDVVCDLGGSVTLSLTASTWILTWDVTGWERRSVGGTLQRDGPRLELLPVLAGGAEVLRYQVTDQTLTLSSDESAWCFDGLREESADFVAVLVRL